MATIAISGVDSAQGAQTTRAAGYGGNLAKTWQKTYQRTYIHYINNAMDKTYTNDTTITSIPGSRVLKHDYGWQVLPYNNLGIALTNQDLVQLGASAQRVKLINMGYKIQQCSVLQENVIARQATTAIENIFESHPSILEWQDTSHVFDSSLSCQPAPASWSDRAAVEISEHLLRDILLPC